MHRRTDASRGELHLRWFALCVGRELFQIFRRQLLPDGEKQRLLDGQSNRDEIRNRIVGRVLEQRLALRANVSTAPITIV